MASVKLILNRQTIHAVAAANMGKLVIDTTRKVANRAKILTPVDTGNLRASIDSKITIGSGEVTGTVYTGVKYAIYVHEGTRPHLIVPRTAKALRFKWHGKTVFARRVNHPGTKGRPFLRLALAEVATPAGFVVKSV